MPALDTIRAVAFIICFIVVCLRSSARGYVIAPVNSLPEQLLPFVDDSAADAALFGAPVVVAATVTSIGHYQAPAPMPEHPSSNHARLRKKLAAALRRLTVLKAARGAARRAKKCHELRVQDIKTLREELLNIERCEEAFKRRKSHLKIVCKRYGSVNRKQRSCRRLRCSQLAALVSELRICGAACASLNQYRKPGAMMAMCGNPEVVRAELKRVQAVKCGSFNDLDDLHRQIVKLNIWIRHLKKKLSIKPSVEPRPV